MAAEQRPRILYFKEYLPTPLCVLLFCIGLSVQRGSISSHFRTDVERIGMPQGRCDDGRICLLHRYDAYFPYPVPSEVPFHHPSYLSYSMSGTYLLQSDNDAYRKHLCTGCHMFCFRILPYVGNL